MPELPEVETIRRELASEVAGRRITAAAGHPSEKFSQARLAAGAAVGVVSRRGKYLIFRLSDDRDLVVHLGMSGQLRLSEDSGTLGEYVRAWWGLDDGRRLELHDVRRFGRVRVTPAGRHEDIPTLAGLGPEPLSEQFTPLGLWRSVQRSSSQIKTQLLSGRPVAGLGNIYADESLWLAGIRPARRSITKSEAERLWGAVREVLELAIAHRGTTFRDYRTLTGAGGDNLAHLNCYGRAGKPCRRCGEELSSCVLGARTTTYCRRCQR